MPDMGDVDERLRWEWLPHTFEDGLPRAKSVKKPINETKRSKEMKELNIQAFVEVEIRISTEVPNEIDSLLDQGFLQDVILNSIIEKNEKISFDKVRVKGVEVKKPIIHYIMSQQSKKK